MTIKVKVYECGVCDVLALKVEELKQQLSAQRRARADAEHLVRRLRKKIADIRAKQRTA